MAYFKLFQRKLTSVDLQLDMNLNYQFLIAKHLYHTFTADYDLVDIARESAKISIEGISIIDRLEYDPEFIGDICDADQDGLRLFQLRNSLKSAKADKKNNQEIKDIEKQIDGLKPKLRDKNPGKYYRQGVNITTLDEILEGLVNNDSIISLYEFKKNFDYEWRKRVTDPRRSMWNLFRILRGFHPADKPVFWRILLTQFCLYHVLTEIRNSKKLKIDEFESIEEIYKKFPYEDIMYKESDKLDWRKKDGSECREFKKIDVIDIPFKTVEQYLNSKLTF